MDGRCRAERGERRCIPDCDVMLLESLFRVMDDVLVRRWLVAFLFDTRWNGNFTYLFLI